MTAVESTMLVIHVTMNKEQDRKASPEAKAVGVAPTRQGTVVNRIAWGDPDRYHIIGDVHQHVYSTPLLI
jgi:hypothetical protein